MRLDYDFDDREGVLMLDVRMIDGDCVRLLQRIDPWVLTFDVMIDGDLSHRLYRGEDGNWRRQEGGKATDPVEFGGCA
jgi:hypothetical protein